MAKIKTLGNTVAITSTVAFKDIELVQKYRASALQLKGGEDNKEVIFSIGVGTPSANDFGIGFDGATRDEAGLAIVSLPLEYKGDDVKGYLADKYGTAITNLEKLEAALPGVVTAIKAEREAIKNNIEIG